MTTIDILDPSVRTGDAMVDGQHRAILATVREIEEAVQNGTARARSSYWLDLFRDYLIEHFKSEDALMVRTKYPYLERHRASHRAIAIEVHGLLSASQNGTVVVPSEIQAVARLFVAHIQSDDREMAIFTKESHH